MLDAIGFEKRGIPAAVVITAPFVPTAEAIAELSGMAGYACAVIPHPVGSLGPAEVRARADAIAGRVEELLLG
ncbi:MAG: hypothetical protein L0027_14455 [Candidatus Rokubacteria bacterium]|nr:hypothetical protein [Candidatus Rokubacteria bacterium]